MDAHAPLRDNVRLLGDLLGQVLREQEGDAFFGLVESIRRVAKAARATGSPTEGLETLEGIDSATAGDLAKAFGIFLDLANIAEQHHRVRRRRDHLQAGSAPQRASFEETFARLQGAGIAPHDLHAAVTSMQLDLVLTAHPTQAARRTILRKHRRIASLLARLDRPDLLPMERDAATRAIHGEITAIWATETVRADRPTPEAEARAGLAVIEQVLWQAVPRYMRELDRRLLEATEKGLPIEAAPIRFGSWIGGDRDGNPHVTAETTRRVLLLNRWMALDLYLRDVDGLRDELSMATAPASLGTQGPAPYRQVLRDVREVLVAARDGITAALDDARVDPPPAGDFGAVLRRCHEALHEDGLGAVADGNLLDTLRRLACFGANLVSLDIRQEAARHRETMDFLTDGAFSGWDEKARIDFLTTSPARPLPTDGPPDVEEVFATFRLLAVTDRDALGAYVISMAGRPSDLLTVAFLQRCAGVADPLPVVPLFETPGDLDNAAATVIACLDDPAAREALARPGIQVMIGYSDSAKEAGMLAAAWRLYRAQEELVAACAQRDVPLTLFHGRGGSVGRGGGPAHQAITALPAGAVRGRIRVTEQGEVIQARFGDPGVALRSLELYTAAVAEATLNPPAEPLPAWRDAVDRMATVSREAYQRTLQEPDFVPGFRQVTPVAELGGLNIGSRPASRTAGDGPESLRAIPWVFAWTQNRLLLPAWLGVDEALATPPDEAMLAWPFWRTTLDLLEMALAKADPAVFEQYRAALAPDWPSGTALAERLLRARERVLTAAGHAHLLDGTPVLQRSITVRNPYVDPIHLLQIDLLRRTRAGDAGAAHALLLTMTGIAAGLRNTG